MALRIRTISEDELDAYVRATEAAFSSVPLDEDLRNQAAVQETVVCMAVLRGHDFEGDLLFGGSQEPAAAVGFAAVRAGPGPGEFCSSGGTRRDDCSSRFPG